MLLSQNRNLLVLLVIVFIHLLILNNIIYSMRNPIAVYCEYGGGIYYTNSTGSYCIINNTYFDALQYFKNNVPPEYSLCAHYGLIYVNSSYCKYPNGTLVNPYTLIPPSAYQDMIISPENKTSCNSLLNCSNTPWYYPPCSNQIYPCFDPPYIPPYYLLGNESYQTVLLYYSKFYLCGYCPENLSFEGNWFRCPYNYSLNQLYQEFIQKCPPPNIVHISCTGVFKCINQTEINLANNLTNNNQQLIYPQPNISTNNNNINLTLPMAIVIVVVIIGLLMLLYYLK